MTITVQSARNEYTANSGQTIFNYTFKIFSNTDLNVYVTPAGQDADDSTDLTTSYTVDAATIGNPSGGFITLSTPTGQDDLVTIVSNVPSARTVDYQNNGDFRPDVVNDDFDRVVSIAKKIEDTANRTVLLEQSQQDPKPLSMERPVAGLSVRWNGSEDGLENYDTSTVSNEEIGADKVVISYLTLSSAINDPSLKLNQACNIKERTTGNGGGAMWDVVLASTVTPNTFDIVQCIGVPTLALKIRDFKGVTAKQMGAVGDGIADDSAAMQALFDLNDSNESFIEEGAYLIETPLTITASPYKIKGTAYARTSVFGAVDSVTTFVNNTGGTLLSVLSTNTSGSYIDGIAIRGNGDNDGQRGLYLDRFFETTLRNVTVRNTRECIDIGTSFGGGGNNDAFYSRIENVEVRNCFTGIRVDAILNGTSFDRVKVGFASSIGITLTDSDTTGTCFNDCYFEASELAIRVVDSKLLEITKCWFEQNTSDLLVVNNFGLIDIHDNRFQSVQFAWMDIGLNHRSGIFSFRNNSVLLRLSLDQRFTFRPNATLSESGSVIIKDNSIVDGILVRPVSAEPWFPFRTAEGLCRNYTISGNKFESIDNLVYFSESKYFTNKTFQELLNLSLIEYNDLTDSSRNPNTYRAILNSDSSLDANTIKFTRSVGGVLDSVPTKVFSIESFDEGSSEDGGSYFCKLYALVNHGTSSSSGASSAKAYIGSFTKLNASDGTPFISPVVEDSAAQASVANSGLRDIGLIAMSVNSVSNYVVDVEFTVDLTGSAISSANIQIVGELVSFGYLTTPIVN